MDIEEKRILHVNVNFFLRLICAYIMCVRFGTLTGILSTVGIFLLYFIWTVLSLSIKLFKDKTTPEDLKKLPRGELPRMAYEHCGEILMYETLTYIVVSIGSIF